MFIVSANKTQKNNYFLSNVFSLSVYPRAVLQAKSLSQLNHIIMKLVFSKDWQFILIFTFTQNR